MKVAVALQERAAAYKNIQSLKRRLSLNATHQEGEAPSEEPSALIAELDECIKRFEELIARINATNSSTIVQGRTITEWIARKDALSLKVGIYDDLIDEASNLSRRASGSEIKIMSSVDVPALRKKHGMMAKELRETDDLIQEANWNTELK